MEKPVSEKEKLKYEIARREGLLGRLLEGGWGSLTAAQSGRIGGLMAAQTERKKKET